MRTLTIIRHAEPGPGTALSGDFGRDLTDQGVQDARSMGVWLSDNLPFPELFLCSPAVRTRTTARVLFETAGIGSSALEVDERLYGCGPSELMHILADYSAVGRIAVIGHNPGLMELAYALSGGICRRLPPGGMVRIDYEGDLVTGLHGSIAAEFDPAAHR